MSQVEQLITENLGVWTSAIKKRGSQGRGSSKKIELYGIKKLRELILDLAVRGLLVTQDPNDEPASVLLEKIAAEKEQLIKDGKIKKQKLLPEITEEEKPFSLSDGWMWLRLPDAAFFQEGPGILAKDFRTVGVPLIRISGMHDNHVSKAGCNFLEPDMVDKKWSHFRLDLGDVVLSASASLGKVAKVDKGTVGCIVYTGLIRFKPYSVLNEDFMTKFLGSNDFARQIDNNKTGAAIKHFGPTHLKGMIIPIPPLDEQPRIVAKVDELMVLCDQLEQQTEDSLSAHQTLVETLLNALLDAAQSRDDSSSKESAFDQAWQRIAEHFDVLFTTEHSIDQLKQTILQLAVMGKLVPQDPDDEPASVLLEKITAEKECLVKEGKIKKQKPLPEIGEDEKPFELPVGWEWCRWNDIAEKIGDIDHKMPIEELNGVPYVSPRDFYPNNVINFDGAKKITREDFERLALKVQPKRGDIIFPRYGTIGANMLVDTDIDFLASYSCCVIKTLGRFISPYYQFIYSISGFVKSQCKKAENKTTQANVGIKSIQEFVVPVPPFEEQSRISVKVDELMSLCDNLKAQIGESQTTQLHLADAMAESALK